MNQATLDKVWSDEMLKATITVLEGPSDPDDRKEAVRVMRELGYLEEGSSTEFSQKFVTERPALCQWYTETFKMYRDIPDTNT